MKINWNIVKAVVALVLAVGVIGWAVNSIRPRAYSGKAINFQVGGGLISATNASEDAVPVQLVGTGSRSFRVSSTIDGVSGSSTRLGTGRDSSQLFEFELPSGVNTFTISGGTDVGFIADTPTELQLSVNPMSNDNRRTAVIATLVFVAGMLFYASMTTDHRWLGILRGQEAPVAEVKPETPTAAAMQGQAARGYGDNRTKR